MVDKIDYFGTGEDAGDHSFLSNFYWFDDSTVEHQYQAAKTLDEEWKVQILGASTPAAAKKLGKRCPIREDWEDVKVSVMFDLLKKKFAPGSLLAEKLLATGDAVLEEGNWWGDKYWGTVLGQGENWLGRLLMMVRGSLRVEKDHESR